MVEEGFMKNLCKFLGITVLAAVMGLLGVGCPTEDSGGNKTSSGFLGDKLELSGQVYLERWNNHRISYQNFTGNLEIADSYGGSGEIRNGKFSYFIERPTQLFDFEGIEYGNPDGYEDEHYYESYWGGGSYFWNYNNVTISNPNVRGLILSGYGGFKVINSDDYRNLFYRGPSDIGETCVSYVYVENDVTVSGTSSYHPGIKDFRLALKAGWNAVHYSSLEPQILIYFSLGSPQGYRWVLGENNDDD